MELTVVDTVYHHVITASFPGIRSFRINDAGGCFGDGRVNKSIYEKFYGVISAESEILVGARSRLFEVDCQRARKSPENVLTQGPYSACLMATIASVLVLLVAAVAL